MNNYWEIFWPVYWASVSIALVWNIVQAYQSGKLTLEDLISLLAFSFAPVVNTLCIVAVAVDWVNRQNFVIWRKK